MSVESDQFWSTTVNTRMAHRLGNVPANEPQDRITAMRRILDREIASVEGALSALKSRKNALSIVYKVPPELLTHIFKLLARISPPVSPECGRLGWINATHVCRRWREIALLDPSLWKRVTFSLGFEWHEEILGRARHGPVIVQADATYSSSSNIVKLLKSCTVHIEELDCRSYCGFPPVFTGYLSSCGLRIHTLRLAENVPALGVILRIPLRPYSDFSTHLRTLVLEGCGLAIECLKSFVGLTRLDIRRANNDSANDLLKAIRCMPLLETLRIHELSPCVQPHRRTSEPPSPFPNLTVIDLVGPAETCTTLLRAISPHPSAHFRLKLYSPDDYGDEQCQEVMEYIATRLRQASTPPLSALLMEGSIAKPTDDWEDSLYSLVSRRDPDDPDRSVDNVVCIGMSDPHRIAGRHPWDLQRLKDDAEADIDVLFRLEFILPWRVPKYIYDSVFRSFPTEGLRALSMDTDGVIYSLPDMGSFLERCPVLEHFRGTRKEAAYIGLQFPRHDEERPSPILDNLVTLSFAKFDLSYFLPDSLMVVRLQAWAKDKHKRGKRLECLDLTECGTPEEWPMDELREVVSSVLCKPISS